MICIEIVSKVRQWVKADGISIREVCRRTGLPRNMVPKYFLNDEHVFICDLRVAIMFALTTLCIAALKMEGVPRAKQHSHRTHYPGEPKTGYVLTIKLVDSDEIYPSRKLR